ncbi:hypothetical protein FRB90_005540, partial [Tulasnella sp. 427]
PYTLVQVPPALSIMTTPCEKTTNTSLHSKSYSPKVSEASDGSQPEPSKQTLTAQLPSPVTSRRRRRKGLLGRHPLLVIALICLAAVCWNIARVAEVLREVDGDITRVRMSGTIAAVPKQLRENGSVPWWKLGVIVLDVDVDVAKPKHPSLTTSGESVPVPTALNEIDN